MGAIHAIPGYCKNEFYTTNLSSVWNESMTEQVAAVDLVQACRVRE